MWQVGKVLVLSPHTDDAEFGAGGTLHRLVSSGVEVFSVVFSTAKESLPDGFPEDILVHEAKAAGKILGLPEENIQIYDYPVRNFPKYRQDILEDLVRLRKTINPHMVLVHASTDVHQDHQTVTEEALRAFKQVTILGYELPWNTIEFRSQAVVALHEENIKAKITALSAYKSQKHRPYASEDFIWGWARGRGVTINAPYAEAFEVLRLIIR
ncbi:LmbE family protein [Clostridiales bacterium PH28_bin88]|nr:LmbE family protein [Clostridiales bacterium PH28_bin88]